MLLFIQPYPPEEDVELMGKDDSDYNAAKEAYKNSQTESGTDNSRHKQLKVVWLYNKYMCIANIFLSHTHFLCIKIQVIPE